MWCDPAAVQMKNLHAYNNTVVNNFGYGVNFLPGRYENFIFENNIFLITGQTDEFTGGNFTGAEFNNNLYWNFAHAQSGITQPDLRFETAPVFADPLLLLPQEGQMDNLQPRMINAIPFFKPSAGSPAVRAGKILLIPAEKDYWGHAISASERPNIGACGK